LAVGGKPPRDVIFYKLVEVDSGQMCPKLKELVEVFNSEVLLKVSFGHPKNFMQSFGDHPIFALGYVEY
jgi:hypothetical protein